MRNLLFFSNATLISCYLLDRFSLNLTVLLSLSVQVFGLGSVAQVVTGKGAFGHYISINMGFGLGVAMGCHIGGKVSGRTTEPPSRLFHKVVSNPRRVAHTAHALLSFQGLT